MKKCIGCGAILQIEDRSRPGYTRSLDMDLCERCFRIRHYGDLTIDMRNGISNEAILKMIEDTEGVIVMIVDILNTEFTVHQKINDALKGRKMIVVFNKLDILPANTNIKRYETYLLDIVKRRLTDIDVIAVLLAHKFDRSLKEVMFDVIKRSKERNFIFVGYYNAGKSTVLNRLLAKDITVTSYYPSTTLNINEIEYEGYHLYDMPGFIYDDNIAMYLEKGDLKKVIPLSEIKPKTFQVYSEQVYIIDDITSLKIKPKTKNGSLTFYISDRLDIHRTKGVNAKEFITKHRPRLNASMCDEISFDLHGKKQEIVINGLGVLSVKDIESVVIKTIAKVGIIERECVF